MCLDSVLGMVLGTVGGGVGKGDVRRCKKNGLLTREQMSSNRLKALLGQPSFYLNFSFTITSVKFGN